MCAWQLEILEALKAVPETLADPLDSPGQERSLIARQLKRTGRDR